MVEVTSKIKSAVVLGSTWTATGAGMVGNVLESAAVTAKLPLLHAAVARMASAQIRNAATLAGNLATASPIGDAAMALLALSAALALTTKLGERRVPVENFYRATARPSSVPMS